MARFSTTPVTSSLRSGSKSAASQNCGRSHKPDASGTRSRVFWNSDSASFSATASLRWWCYSGTTFLAKSCNGGYYEYQLRVRNRGHDGHLRRRTYLRRSSESRGHACCSGVPRLLVGQGNSLLHCADRGGILRRRHRLLELPAAIPSGRSRAGSHGGRIHHFPRFPANADGRVARSNNRDRDSCVPDFCSDR